MAQCMGKLPLQVIHYGKRDPHTHMGGVETFARNLSQVFEDVEFMTPATLDATRVMRERRVVICDNHTAPDWPDEVPLIGFQHGVAAVKCRHTLRVGDISMAWRQGRAACRQRTVWVACAQWISDTFAQRHGNRAEHIIYHHVQERFDGKPGEVDPRLILHDARTDHKGRRQVARLSEAFPAWRFEPLSCRPEEVPDRMRRARAFVHLSFYEGNSIVCNEAMAMDLPCFFTRVGLMRDAEGPTDIHVVDAQRVRRDARYLRAEFGRFLDSLKTRTYHPRHWTRAHATIDINRRTWAAAIGSLQTLSGWDLTV